MAQVADVKRLLDTLEASIAALFKLSAAPKNYRLIPFVARGKWKARGQYVALDTPELEHQVKPPSAPR